jgi:hypothetical protein
MPGVELNRTEVSFNLTSPNQDRNDRYLQPAELTKLVNMVRDKKGRLVKRNGNESTTTTEVNGGSVTTPIVAMEACDLPLVRDSADALFILRDDTAYFRGAHPRCSPTWFSVRTDNPPATKTTSVYQDGLLWGFSLTSAGYQLTIVDPRTRQVVRQTEAFADAGANAIAAVFHDGSVRVFTTAGSTTVKCHSFASITASPTTTTWLTESGKEFIGVDAAVYGSNCFVAAISIAAFGLSRSYGSGSTALAQSFESLGGLPQGLCILEHDGADGFAYVSLYHADGGGTTFRLIHQKVDIDIPSTATTVTHVTGLDFVDEGFLGLSMGFVDPATTNVLVFGAWAPYTTGNYRPQLKHAVATNRYTYNGVSSTALPVAPGGYPASKAFRIGDEFFWLSGFDDGDYLFPHVDPYAGQQLGYFVRDVDGIILSTVLDAEGVLMSHSLADPATGHHIVTEATSHVAPVHADGTEAFCSLLSAGDIKSTSTRQIVTIDFDASYFSSMPGVAAGGIPVAVDASTLVEELAPILYPVRQWDVAPVGAGAVTHELFLTYLFRIGNRRSAPYPQNISALSVPSSTEELNLTLGCLGHVLPETQAWIEVYGNEPGDNRLYLQHVFENDPSQATITVEVNPTNWKAGQSRPLYSSGGIPNISPEPARVVWKQGSRCMAGGTPSGEIWASHEITAGDGIRFNPALNIPTDFGEGELQAGIGLDSSTSALFKETAIAIAQGNPDGRASGGWLVTGVNTKKGCSNPRAVVLGSQGVYFPDHATGRMQLLQGVSVADISAGMVAYKDFTWTAAIDCPDERCIRWYASNGKRLCLYYEDLNESAPYGTWALEDGDGLVPAVGARLISQQPVMVEAGDDDVLDEVTTWAPSDDYNDGAEPVLINWKIGRISPAGSFKEFNVDTLRLSTEHVGGESDYLVTLTGDFQDPEEHEVDASEVSDIEMISNIVRTRETSIEVQETAATGAGDIFDGVLLVVASEDKIRKTTREAA